MAAFVLSQKDRDLLAVMVRREIQRTINTQSKPSLDPTLGPSPEVYIALIPDGGIDGITEVDNGDDEVADPVECDIYQLMPKSQGDSTLVLKEAGFSVDVHNLGLSAVQPPYAIVQRNGYGEWVTSSGGSATLAFELTADLTAGESASAKLLEWDEDTDTYSTVGSAFTLFDDINAATLGGKTGDQGLFYHVESDYRIISSISTIALWIEYTIHATGGDLEDTDSTHLVTVSNFHVGSDPGSTVTVHFEEKWEANVGNVGKAILGSDGNYHNLTVDCLT